MRQVRVLGIDTSLRSTGVGIVEAKGNSLSAAEYGHIGIAANVPLSSALGRINTSILELIDRTEPSVVSIEGIFYCRNLGTAVKLGEARGAAIAACASRGLTIYEYAPRKVKQAVVGYGNAGKQQVRKMLLRILNLSEEPQEDAGDALAIAVCHLHNMASHVELAPKPI